MTTQGYSRERSEGVSERVTMQRDYRERREGGVRGCNYEGGLQGEHKESHGTLSSLA